MWWRSMHWHCCWCKFAKCHFWKMLRHLLPVCISFSSTSAPQQVHVSSTVASYNWLFVVRLTRLSPATTSTLMARQPLVSQDLLNVDASRTHTDTPFSVGPLWTSDQLEVETYTWQHTTLKKTDIHASGGIRTRSPSKRANVDLRLRTRGRWNRWYHVFSNLKHWFW